jgi:RND family efflux transporter MFP subunit
MKFLHTVLVASTLVLVGCNTKKEQDKEAVELEAVQEVALIVAVDAVVTTQKSMSRQVRSASTIEGIRSATLTAKSGGVITSVPAKLGKKVSRGSLLMSVESGVQKASLDQAIIAKDEAQLNFDAVEKLFEKERISKSEFIGAKNRLAGAASQVELAQLNLRNCRVTAPFYGVVGSVEAGIESGNSVAPGQPIARVVNISKLKVTLHLGEREIGLIKKGDSAVVKITAADTSLVGVVTAISEASDPGTGSFAVEVEVKNSDDRRVKSGMSCSVSLVSSVTNEGFSIPTKAIRDVGGQSVVYTADSGIVTSIPVTVTWSGEGEALVLGELAGGDTVVTSGFSRISLGSKVSTTLREWN